MARAIRTGLSRRPAYLERLEARRLRVRLEREAVFGIGMGWILALGGLFEAYFTIRSNETLWCVVSGIGAGFIVLGIVLPQAFHPLERGWSFATQWIGHTLFTIILVVAYFLVISPVGAYLRKKRGAAPIYAWDGEAPPVEGWVPKKVMTATSFEAGAREYRFFMVRHPLAVLGFFLRRGQLLLLPALFLLLVLGLVLLFVQSSSLAPFIYTLF